MKFKTLFSIFPLLCLLSFGIVEVGCKTSAIDAMVKTEGVIIISVDTGMRIWADQVNSGHATQSQVDTVKQAYNAYYTAQLTAKAAIESVIVNHSTNVTDVATANVSVSNAEAALLSVLNQFIIPQ